MTIHYHGTPITPRETLLRLAGRHFCVSFARPEDVRVVHEIGQSVMLDNGAFSAWTRGLEPDWNGYRDWCKKWLRCRSTWAVIPDVIDGDERENDALVSAWPFPASQSAPVWHMHESISRLMHLCRNWPRVCIGSSREYADVGSPRWHERMHVAFNAISPRGYPMSAIHLLRGMAASGWHYPLASVDSTDIARNHNRGDAVTRAQAWDQMQTPIEWQQHPEQQALCG